MFPSRLVQLPFARQVQTIRPVRSGLAGSYRLVRGDGRAEGALRAAIAGRRSAGDGNLGRIRVARHAAKGDVAEGAGGSNGRKEKAGKRPHDDDRLVTI
jgi:hypothetical protein